jgi:Rieske Fe-S protein
MDNPRSTHATTTDPDGELARPLVGLGLSRRNVVLGASVVGAAGLLAACGGSGDAATAGSGGDASSTPPGSSASSDDNGGDTGGGSDDGGGGGNGGGNGGGGGGGSEKLASTSDVPVKGGTINKDAKVVVTQPASGTFKAFSAVCTHQSCLVGSVENNVITCPCHGSQYSATDGSVMGGPAPTPLPEVSVTVSGDEIVKA